MAGLKWPGGREAFNCAHGQEMVWHYNPVAQFSNPHRDVANLMPITQLANASVHIFSNAGILIMGLVHAHARNEN